VVSAAARAVGAAAAMAAHALHEGPATCASCERYCCCSVGFITGEASAAAAETRTWQCTLALYNAPMPEVPATAQEHPPEPHLNSCMMASRSFWGMSPCMDDTVKLCCRILSVSQSTFRLVLQKMTACVIVSVSYRSHSVSNFHSSRSTATKNCLMPCTPQPQPQSAAAAPGRSGSSSGRSSQQPPVTSQRQRQQQRKQQQEEAAASSSSSSSTRRKQKAAAVAAASTRQSATAASSQSSSGNITMLLRCSGQRVFLTLHAARRARVRVVALPRQGAPQR
jgi:hypothetical protein